MKLAYSSEKDNLDEPLTNTPFDNIDVIWPSWYVLMLLASTNHWHSRFLACLLLCHLAEPAPSCALLFLLVGAVFVGHSFCRLCVARQYSPTPSDVIQS